MASAADSASTEAMTSIIGFARSPGTAVLSKYATWLKHGCAIAASRRRLSANDSAHAVPGPMKRTQPRQEAVDSQRSWSDVCAWGRANQAPRQVGWSPQRPALD